MSFAGKTAVITGGATGIGRSLATSLANEGAKVAIADIDLDNAQAVAEEIESQGGKAHAYACDVADQQQVTQVFSRVFRDFDQVEFAFINAGVVQLGKLQDLNVSDLEWMFRVNVIGALLCARAFVDESRKTGGAPAHITFTGSENSLSIPASGRYMGPGGYNMTKHAMHSMAEMFRFELADENISVSLAVPGGVTTEIMSSVKKRQEQFGGAGKLDIPDLDAIPKDLDAPPNINPDQAAGVILTGVANRQFYIPTHAHILDDFRKRAAEIEAAFNGASFIE